MRNDPPGKTKTTNAWRRSSGILLNFTLNKPPPSNPVIGGWLFTTCMPLYVPGESTGREACDDAIPLVLEDGILPSPKLRSELACESSSKAVDVVPGIHH